MASPHTFAVLFGVHTLHAIVHASVYLNIQPRGCLLLFTSVSMLHLVFLPTPLPASSILSHVTLFFTIALHPHYLYVCPPPSYTVSPSQVFFVSLSDVLFHFLTFIFLPLLLQPAILSCLLTLLPTLIFSDFFSFSSLVPRPSVFVHNNTVEDWRIVVNANRR